MWAGRRVVLGVSGGIACYKSCFLARRLTEAGARVDVVLTRSAAEFVGPVTFEALTGRPVLTSLWEPGRALAHVRLPQDADLIIVAPATAHLIARMAQGLADDVLTTLLLARTAPVLLAPAMNDEMYARPETQANLERLRARGVAIVGPEIGALAEGPSERPGRMSEPETILAHAARLLRGAGEARRPPRGRHRGTDSRIDRSGAGGDQPLERQDGLPRGGGRLGAGRGGGAHLRAGRRWRLRRASRCGGSRAPASSRRRCGASCRRRTCWSWRRRRPISGPAIPSASKRSRVDGALAVPMEPTEDILSGTRELRKAGSIIVGFALETGDALAKGRAKLERKDLDFIVVNDALEPGAGFEHDTNRVAVLGRDGTPQILPLQSKRDVAEAILDAVERSLG